MKIIALFAAGALAAGTLISAAPAEAQRGWDGPRGGWNGGGWNGGGWNGNRGWRGGNRWHGPRYGGGYRGGYRGRRGGYGWNGGYGRPRVVCHIVRGYYGPERRCFRR